jgi:dihydroorotate dehydrogenase (NAD+) catalytic subunit
MVTKSIGPVPREMYPGPVCVESLNNVVLNAMGLPNPGVDVFSEMLRTEQFSKPVLVSIFGGDAEEYASIGAKMAAAGAAALELNLSCPHSKPGSRDLIIGQQPELIEEVVQAVRDSVDIPIYAKLSPNTTNIVDDAAAALAGGANGLSLINTVTALEVDPYVGRPIIGNLFCGFSGPALRPIAQRKLAEVALAMRRDEIPIAPIIAMGGITNGLDVASFIMLGAAAVQVGSALIWKDVGAFDEMLNEFSDFMEQQGYTTLDALRGVALDAMEGLN